MLFEQFRATQRPVVMGPGLVRNCALGRDDDVDTPSHSRDAKRPSCAENIPPSSEGAGNAGRLVRPLPHVQG